MEVKIQENLINFKLDSSTKKGLFAMIGIGIVSLAAGFLFFHDPSRHGEHSHSNIGWSALLVGTFFIIGIALSGTFFTAMSNLTGSSWAISFRRIAESYGLFLPVVIVLLIATFFGIHDLYEWSHKEVVAEDHLIKHKSGWLNVPFFVIRLTLFAIVWSVFGYLFHKHSTEQDKDKALSHTKTSAVLAGAFIVIYALTFCITSFDLLMSLTPHWFSTMFGIYCFAGAYQSGLASFIVIIYYLKKKGYLGDLVNENHIHDIGKFLLGFCVFWAYVGFSQFMLIWYANIPEETFWFEQRLTGGWTPITIALPFIKFILPFLLLLNRPAKRDLDYIFKVAVWVIFTQILEIYWIVFPSNFENFNPLTLVVSIGTAIGMIGLFGFVVLKRMESNKLIPVGDPRLDESLHHHQ